MPGIVERVKEISNDSRMGEEWMEELQRRRRATIKG